MARQWAVEYTPDLDADRGDFIFLEIGFEVLPDQIAVYVGDNVRLSRITEINNAWEWLLRGVKERNLLDGPPWQGAVLYTGADADALTTNNRRTESALATLTEDDIMLGIGANVTAQGDTESLWGAFTLLRQFALENNLKAA